MYAIIDYNNVCIGMLKNHKAAIREAKKLGAKCVKKIENVNAYADVYDAEIWERTPHNIKYKILGIIMIVFSVVITMLCYETNEPMDGALFIFCLGVAAMFYHGEFD